jgi:hypothetical protein
MPMGIASFLTIKCTLLCLIIPIHIYNKNHNEMEWFLLAQLSLLASRVYSWERYWGKHLPLGRVCAFFVF